MSFLSIEPYDGDQMIPIQASKRPRVYKIWTTIFSSVDNLNGLNSKEFHKLQCTDFVNSMFKHKFFSVNTII